jgi:hypothetical protein
MQIVNCEPIGLQTEKKGRFSVKLSVVSIPTIAMMLCPLDTQIIHPLHAKEESYLTNVSISILSSMLTILVVYVESCNTHAELS